MIVRAATPDDMGFIFETFLRSIRAASTHVEGMANSDVVKMLSNLIANGWWRNVAEAEGYLAGWIVAANDNHMAWIYVRDMFRWRNYKDHPVTDMLLSGSNIDPSRRIVTPFLPNRNKRSWQFAHRPFLVMPNG